MITTLIEHLQHDPNLYIEENFVERMQALDRLEFELLDEIELLSESTLTDGKNGSVPEEIQALKCKLDEVNERLFAHLLTCVQASDWNMIRQFFRQVAQQSQRTDDIGYDELDMLVNGLLEVDLVPEESRERDADMLFYQPTPARIILKLLDQLRLTHDDVLYDLGSGLGHVPILITLLTGIKTKGVERDDVYVHYSEACLKKLHLSNVEFITDDARNVDYSDGTVFYMYTPFQGEILQDVLSKLEAVSKQRPISLCAYGPCTLQVSKQSWLKPTYQSGKREDCFGIFVSM